MSSIKRGIAIVIYLIYCNASAYSQEVSFRHLNINNGLSQNAVFSMIQDSHGFMWFGTKDGLNRYDGYNFVNYYHNSFDSTTISGSHITSLMEDRRGLIWAGTLKDGLNYFQPYNQEFQLVRLDTSKSSQSFSFEILCLKEDLEGNIYAGTWGGGLYRVNIIPSENNVSGYPVYKYKSTIIKKFEKSKISSIHSDSNGILWLTTEKELIEYHPISDQIINKYIFKTPGPRKFKKGYSTEIHSMYESNNGSLWLGTNAGLIKFDKHSRKHIFFPHQYESHQYGWGKITKIVEDKMGYLWLATPAELLRFKPETGKYESFKNDPYDPSSISYNQISSLWVDKTNILWVGTAGMGISIYNPVGNRFSKLNIEKDPSSRITGLSIESILEDHRGNIWFSAGVLYCWEPNNNKIHSFEDSPDKPEIFGNSNTWSMIESTDKAIWTATDNGLYRYDQFTGKYRRYNYNPSNPKGLSQMEVFTVYEDDSGMIWAITEKYLNKLIDPEKGIFIHYMFPNGPSNNKIPRPVIYQDQNRIFWMGTKHGLVRFNSSKEEFTYFRHDPDNPLSLNNNLIKSIIPDPNRPAEQLWIGTDGGGINLFNKKEKSFRHYTSDDGLPNNVIYGILPDKNGNLWLSTNKGISKFNPGNESFRNFDVMDGLQSNEFNTGAFYLAQSGEMFFGGIHGLNYFHPGKIQDNLNIPDIVITSFEILDQKEKGNRKETYLNLYDKTETLVLSHEDDNISFEFAALDFSAPEKNQYAYKLVNFNSDWIYSGSTRKVTYTNLPPGDYVFKVKASNNDGIWNEEGISLPLVIKPPWGTSWWAYSIYGILLISIILFIRRYELARISLKSQLKFEKVETDSLRNLDQLKSNFFANISHEFRTPLTLILGQINKVLESRINPKDKERLQIADKNANRLLDLINQLLDLSKIESGSMEISKAYCNIVSFSKNLFYSFESLADTKGILMKFESTEEHIPVLIDRDKMEKIFYNLVSNAFKFTEEKGEIRIRIIKTADSSVEIKISDTGIGIPSDKIQKVFDRFYQIDSSDIRKHEGTGIGLALTKELVVLHNGSIRVESEEKKGTTFILKLPVIENETMVADDNITVNQIPETKFNAHLDQTKTATEKSSSAELPLKNGTTILLVEDNSDVRNYISEELEDKYNVLEARNGREGLSIASKGIPDLIISDVMMPEMDGYQFCQEIRKDEKTAHIPIIMLTAKASLTDKLEGLETGIDDYLTKPFNEKELKVRIKNLIKQREKLRKKFSESTIIRPSEVSTISIDQAFLEKVIKIIESNFENENFAVEILAENVNMSVSQLNRKLNAMIDQPAGKLIRSMKLQRAADLLGQNAGSISEICYKLGFNDQAYFSRAFKKQFGCTPKEYKENSKLESGMDKR